MAWLYNTSGEQAGGLILYLLVYGDPPEGSRLWFTFAFYFTERKHDHLYETRR